MKARRQTPISVLIVGDDPEVHGNYRHLRLGSDIGHAAVGAAGRLLGRGGAPKPLSDRRAAPVMSFDAAFCGRADEAVGHVQERVARDRPFAVVLLDIESPQGVDTVRAAARIREIDPAVEIVICVGDSIVDTAEVGSMVPPEEKLSYLQKPFHPQELRQLLIALGSKWQAERRIVRLAYFDVLTGLPNRQQFHNRLLGAVETAREQQRMLAVLYLDLDKFKAVNDTFGHGTGDELLRVIARRLKNTLRCEDAAGSDPATNGRPGDLARLGGDEFVVILPQLRRASDAGVVAERLIAALRDPVQMGTNSLVITPSVGVAIYPHAGSDAETLLRNADAAMYFAKRKRPGSYAVFDAAMAAAALEPRASEDPLNGACGENELEIRTARTFGVLAAFCAEKRTLDLNEIAAAARISTDAALGSIHTLVRLGYLARSEQSGGWVLAPRTLSVGCPYLAGHPVIDQVSAHLVELNKTCGESVSLSEPDGTEMVFLARFLSHRRSPIQMPVGRRLPMYCTSAGRAYLSTLPREEVRELLQRSTLQSLTSHTLTQLPRILEIIDSARELGYAWAIEECYRGDLTVGAPIVGPDGRAIAAVNISGPTERWSMADLRARLVPLLLDTARAASREFAAIPELLQPAVC